MEDLHKKYFNNIERAKSIGRKEGMNISIKILLDEMHTITVMRNAAHDAGNEEECEELGTMFFTLNDAFDRIQKVFQEESKNIDTSKKYLYLG